MISFVVLSIGLVNKMILKYQLRVEPTNDMDETSEGREL